MKDDWDDLDIWGGWKVSELKINNTGLESLEGANGWNKKYDLQRSLRIRYEELSYIKIYLGSRISTVFKKNQIKKWAIN